MDHIAAARGAIVCFHFNLVELHCCRSCDGDSISELQLQNIVNLRLGSGGGSG